MKGRLSKVSGEHTKWWDTERLCLKLSKALLLPGKHLLFQLSTSTKHRKMMFVADALESSQFPTIMQKRERLWISITKCRHCWIFFFLKKEPKTHRGRKVKEEKGKPSKVQNPECKPQKAGKQRLATKKQQGENKEGRSFKQQGEKNRNTQGPDTGTQEMHDEKKKKS